jgi:aspartate ammonia-lyase
MAAYIQPRQERDSIGIVAVPADAYFGAQTARAIQNFPISQSRLSNYPALVKSLVQVKLAAARANHRLGKLDISKLHAIEHACARLLEGDLYDQFPVDMFQGGAGTSTNMNVNEVIANAGLEHLGRPRGDYVALHPNDDVNCSQSTNDVYPTAARMSLLYGTAGLQRAIEELVAELATKGQVFESIVKLGRTQLQDAVPMTLGQEFQAYASAIRDEVDRLLATAVELRAVNLGGTAIGTGINTDADYQALVLEELNSISGLDLRAPDDLMAASWDVSAFVAFSSQLKRLAIKLSKIASDLRLLSSGPRGGIGEIILPGVQPGSSIMPGKINPVIPEAVNQVAFHVIGADVTVTLAAEAGQLQLNAFEPVIIGSLLNSVSLLTNVVTVLDKRCVQGIKADPARCSAHLNESTAMAAAFVPFLGYERAVEFAHAKLTTGKTWSAMIDDEQGPQVAELRELIRDPIMLTSSHRVVLRHQGTARHKP